MIQIYKTTNVNYEYNGDMTLFPTKCEIDTSTWQMTLEHPIDEENRWKYIVEEAVIKAPSFNGDQLFRIDEIYKSDSGIEATAYPIFFDAKDEVLLTDIRPTNKTGQDALNIMMNGTKYSGYSDITKSNTAYYERMNLLEALQGSNDNSFVNRWGGEVMYDNYKIIIKERLGSDRGISIEVGKNVAYDGLNETISMNDVVTRIYPQAYNGRRLSTEYIDSPLINQYTKVRLKTLKFDDIKLAEDVLGEEENVIICANQTELDAALVERCNTLFSNGLDKPSVTINADLVLLQNTTAYGPYKHLEEVQKGDTVYCKHSRLGIISKARVVNLVYDCISKKTIKVEIGDHIKDYVEKTSNIINSVENVMNVHNNTLMGDKIAGILNLMNVSLKAQKDIAQKQDVRAILFEDSDPDSPTFGAMCIGTQGIQIAKKRNETNTDWAWGTAIDFQAIYAQYIIAGTLSDKLGLNYWNLDTGEFRLSANTKVGNTTLDDYIKNKIPDTDDLSQEEVFNALTNNGSIKGIYMYNGQLYVNGGYINADTLSAISANLGNITAGSININGKFIVTSDGKVTATDGTFTGTVNAKSGSIAGFTFDENVMTASITKTFNYTESDYIRIRNIILGTTTATSADYERLDINGDGRISSQDYVMIKNLISYGNKITTTFKLDPRLNDGNIKEAMLEISVPNYNTTRISKLGALYSSYASFDYISLEGNDIKDIFSPVGAKTDNGSLVKLWEGSSRVTDEFTVSDDYKFFLVRPGTASGYYNTWIIVPYLTESNSGVFRGIGGFEDSAGGEIYFLRGSVTNGNAKIETCWYRTTANMTNNNSSVQCYIKEVWGVK